MPQPTRTRRRTATALLLITILALPLVLAPTASGDRVIDKKVEAQRISARLDTLRRRAEVLAEDYNNAKIRLAQVRGRVRAAKRATERTNREVRRRQRDLARFAVSAYTSADDSAGTIDLVLKGAGSDLGSRDGYASAAVGDKADLVDSLRAAKSDGAARLADLRRAEKHAGDAEAAVAKKRKAASAAVAETTAIYERVQGELKRLVAAEQARVAAAQRARAEAAARVASSRASAAQQTSAARAQATAPAPARRSTVTTQPAPPAPSAPAPAPVGQGAGAAIAAARSVLGVRYSWGGASPATGFDCSGLVMWSWAQGGKSLPHSSQAMYGASRKIPVSSLQPGDLVFYGSPVHHVALYIGGGSIIHAPHTGSYVQVASLNYWSDLAGAGRV